MTRNFYELLGVDEDASKEEIRDAFREMVQEYHPDRNDDPRATAQFTAIKKAYDTLKDPSERQSYDRLGHTNYVAKRLDGIPEPSSWPSEDDEESASDTDTSTSRTSSGAAGSSSGTQRGTSSASGSTSGSGTTASSTDYSSGSSTSTSRSTTTGGTSSTTTGSSSSTTGSSSSTTGGTSSNTTGRSSTTTNGSTSSSTNQSSSSTAGSSTGSGTATGTSRSSTTRSNSSSSSPSESSAQAGATAGTANASTAANASATGSATASTSGSASASTAGASTGTTERTDSGQATSGGGVSELVFGNALVQWIGSKRLGWRAIILSFGLYLAGLAHYGYENAAGIGTLVTDLQAAGTDTDTLQALLLGPSDEYVIPAWEYVYVAAPAEIGPSIVFALGTVVMPLVFFLAIRRTRNHRGRNLSYLFALAVFVPLVVLAATGANAVYGVVDTIPLVALLLGYAVVPLLAGFVLIGRRFVWTPLRAAL